MMPRRVRVPQPVRAVVAGTLIRSRRSVALLALAWNSEASAPAARRMFWVMAARATQAALALKSPDVISSPL